MATQLSLYNGALRNLGERSIALSENREPRRLLDDVWNDGAVDFVLEQGLWEFAIRTQKMIYDPDFAPDFGYRYVYQKPTDYIRTASVCTDEYFNNPLTQYADEIGYWYCDLTLLYVKFVSNNVGYGSNLAAWPQSVCQYAESWMALQIAPRVLQDEKKVAVLEKATEKKLIRARSTNAMNEPAKFLPRQSWSRARLGSSGLFYDPVEQK